MFPVTPVMVNAVIKRTPVAWTPHITLPLQRQTVSEAISHLLSQLPLLGLTDTNKTLG